MTIDLVLRLQASWLVSERTYQYFETGKRMFLLILLTELIHVSSYLVWQIDPLNLLISPVLLGLHH